MSAILKTRVSGAWVNTSKKGAVRLGGTTIAFGPTSNPAQSLFIAGVDEPVGDFDEGSGITLATGMAFNVPGKITHGRYRFPNTPIGTYTWVLYRSGFQDVGSEVARAVFQPSDIVPGGWGTVALTGGGYTISTGTAGSGSSGGVAYWVAVYTSAGRYTARGGVFNTAGKTSGNIYAWSTSENYLGDFPRTNGRYDSGDVYPTRSFNGSSYYADVVFVAS